ncbi:MAG: molybdate ABC transporter substrate-binding protein [Chloroflexi bacterium]|nr:molybdate ABC transporter substrate-binding protein [Chloroflexota bacterium]
MNLKVTSILVAVVLVGACQPQAPTRLGSASSGTPSASAAVVPSAPTSVAPVDSGAPPAALTIYGAASLKGALEQVNASYETGHPGTTLTLSTDSSAALATQIEQGAPADVFLSADITYPRKLADKGLADGAVVNFAGNVLTIIVPADNPGGLATPADLAKSGVKVIAAGDDVPITTYAKQVADLLAKIPGYPAGFATAYDANVVTKEDNVKAVVAKIELGEGDAGIVYVTDAMASAKVGTIAFPAEANVAVIYAGVVVKDSTNLVAAHAFLDWLSGAEAQLVLARLGFTAPAS